MDSSGIATNATRLNLPRFRGFVSYIAQELWQPRIGLLIEATGGGFKLRLLDWDENDDVLTGAFQTGRTARATEYGSTGMRESMA